jgi:catechol 2,3-dioxygenase
MSRATVHMERVERAVISDRDAELADVDPRGLPIARPYLHHVNLKTTRRDEMIEWYRVVVGLQVTFRGAGAAWLTNDAANHRIALVTGETMRIDLSDDPEKAIHAGLYHTAWEYRSLDALLAAYSRLKELGILPQRMVNHGPTTSFYYNDPDGNGVELQSDNFGDWGSSRAFMTDSPDFARDPLGPKVVPELMIAAREAGVSEEDVLQRAYAGEYDTAGREA